jgi:2-polyprenyl-6-methoxyphenol hydroxylase-like FAD-dependent oxidoreductase
MTAEDTAGTEVLIVGAGPVGLTLAIELRRRGIDCRLVERNDSTVETSRALGIQPRTLQMFEDIDALDPVLEQGVRAAGQPVYHGDRELFFLDLDAVDTPYPYLWVLPQNHTESILRDRLRELGGEVEFERELVGFGQDGEGVTATVTHRDSGRTETIEATWLVGCDGGRSRVRKTLGLAFEGTTQREAYLNVDARIDWDRPEDEAGVWLHEDGVFAVLPLPGEGRWRLFAEVPDTPAAEQADEGSDPGAYERLLEERTGLRVTVSDVTWTTTFTVNQRLAEHYRRGRVFLAGDAAHVHSPVGGVGMNTGIQDAYNLGWKLALVVRDVAPGGLLDSYEAERRPVAADVLRTTGSATSLLAAGDHATAFLRDRVLPTVLRSKRVQARVLRADTQLDIGYRDGPLADGHAEPSALGRLAGLSRRFRGKARAPRPDDRAPNGDLRDSTGRPTTLFEATGGEPGYRLLLFAGTGTGTGTGTSAGDDLAGIARKLHALAGGLVRPFLIVPEGERPSETVTRTGADAPTVLVDPDGALHERYGASVPSAYLVRPDGHVGFRSRPARTLALVGYLDAHLSLPVEAALTSTANDGGPAPEAPETLEGDGRRREVGPPDADGADGAEGAGESSGRTTGGPEVRAGRA